MICFVCKVNKLDAIVKIDDDFKPYKTIKCKRCGVLFIYNIEAIQDMVSLHGYGWISDWLEEESSY